MTNLLSLDCRNVVNIWYQENDFVRESYIDAMQKDPILQHLFFHSASASETMASCIKAPFFSLSECSRKNFTVIPVAVIKILFLAGLIKEKLSKCAKYTSIRNSRKLEHLNFTSSAMAYCSKEFVTSIDSDLLKNSSLCKAKR